MLSEVTRYISSRFSLSLFVIHRSYASVHFKMRKTLRRSCDTCAKSKLSCDLRTPQCTRCIKKKSTCVYANQPLTSSLSESTPTLRNSPEIDGSIVRPPTNPMILFNTSGLQSFDPFESYPQTRLPRAHVQRLIQHCESHNRPIYNLLTDS